MRSILRVTLCVATLMVLPSLRAQAQVMDTAGKTHETSAPPPSPPAPSTSILVLTRLSTGIVKMDCGGAWEGVGFEEGSTIRGVFRESSGNVAGTFTAKWGSGGYLKVRRHPTQGPSGESDMEYLAIGDVASPLRQFDEGPHRTPTLAAPFVHPIWPPEQLDAGPMPGPDDKLALDRVPQPVTSMSPVYPEDARKNGIQGTVEVNVLVDRNGVVRDARIVTSIPALDAATLAAVRQWHFQPAMMHGKPAACWVVVPVKFTLH
jgi:TonB family protein